MKKNLTGLLSILMIFVMLFGTCVTTSAFSESDYIAAFRITTDKETAKTDDIITVSVHLKTNYYIYTMSLPVIYDASVFEMQNTSLTNLKSFLTFEGQLAEHYSKNGNWKSPEAFYTGRNSNPEYWSKQEIQDKYKIAFATWTADTSISSDAVMLTEEETILSFKLKATCPISDMTDKIFISNDFQKTSDFAAGILFVGRNDNEYINANTFIAVGQTIVYNPETKDIAKASVNIIPDVYETGSAVKPEPSVTYNGTVLTKGIDYTLSYQNNINVGTASVTINGIGKYKGTKTVNFNILEQLSVSECVVSEIPDVYETGSAIKPEPSVTYNGTALVKGTDYTLSYQNNTNAGTASVTVNGIGKYKGTKTVNFEIKKSAVTDIVLSDTSISMTYKSSASLKAVVLPENAGNKNVIWSSSDPNVVSVDANGNLYAAKKGSAVITASSADGTVKESCTVEVTYSAIQWLIVILLFGWIWY